MGFRSFLRFLPLLLLAEEEPVTAFALLTAFCFSESAPFIISDFQIAVDKIGDVLGFWLGGVGSRIETAAYRSDKK